MITLTPREIIKITKNNLDHSTTIYGAEGLKYWILFNKYDNHAWVEQACCHKALHKMVKSGYLIKVKKGEFTKNPLYD